MSKSITTTPDTSRSLTDSVNSFFNTFTGGNTPQVQVEHKTDEVLVSAHLPDYSKEDLDLRFANGYLYLKAGQQHETQDTTDTSKSYSRSYQSYYQSLPLGEDLNWENSTAQFKDGELQIHIPRDETKTPQQQSIPIS